MSYKKNRGRRFLAGALSTAVWLSFSSALPALSAGAESDTVERAPKPAAAPGAESGWTITVDGDEKCQIKCIDPHPACPESARLIDLLKVIYEAYARSDLDTISKYMADDCTTFDESTKHLVTGKQAVLKDIEQKLNQYRTSDSPLVSYTIEHPYAQVTDNMGTISFMAYKVFGGKHPQKFESHCTDIFVKRDGEWKKLHYRSNWKPVG